MKRVLLIISISFYIFHCYGQGVSKADTQAYEQYLTKTFAQYYPFSMLQRVYKYLYAYQEKGSIDDRYVFTDDSKGRGDTGNWEPADKGEGLPTTMTEHFRIPFVLSSSKDTRSFVQNTPKRA